jgi:hypothetical protein
MTTQTVPIITLRMLRGACSEQKRVFKAEWPAGASATLENVLRAVELGLDLEWGRRLFSPTARAEYDQQEAPLRAEYYREWALLRDEYHREWALLRDEHKREGALLRAEHKRQGATLWQAWAEHKRQVALLLAKYQRQIAPFWLAAFLASHGGVE